MKPTKLFTAEHTVVVYHHAPESGVTIKDVLKPDYWTHVAPSLRTGHRIEILSADASWWAMLIVRATGRHEAIVQALQHVELGASETIKSQGVGYEVKWLGGSKKHGVIRTSDDEIIKDEFAVKEAAVKWMNNHIKSLAA